MTDHYFVRDGAGVPPERVACTINVSPALVQDGVAFTEFIGRWMRETLLKDEGCVVVRIDKG